MSYANKSIPTLLRMNPWTEDVFDWYGIDLGDVDPSTSLETVCWLFRLNTADVVRDLEAAASYTWEDDLAWAG